MFSHTLSKILYDKGVKSHTDKWWTESGNLEDTYYKGLSNEDWHKMFSIPAFNLLDLLIKENALKLFKKSTCCELCGTLLFGSKCSVHPHEAGYVEQWEYILHELLDLHLSGGEQAVEDRLVEMLISKT